MSGTSYLIDCPRCGCKETLHCYADWKPHDGVSGLCLQCGYAYYTELMRADLEELDAQRKDYEFTPTPPTPEMEKQMVQYDKDNGVKKK